MDTLLDCKNVLFDTSSSLMFLDPAYAVDMLHHFGVNRFMWGSDFPMWDHKDELDVLYSLDLDEKTLKGVLYNNFAAFYGLPLDE